ncbi:proline dehydrogenase family protein [uncultured Amphritea sp.]|uniref:proline dehydrogenase family protein n=1 Tax=uncultured Amphritea sp. TaxID=981605 RepID=UPI0026005122|nr:proline dehydrogenase family protein [uncultured Amphritea sp.]
MFPLSLYFSDQHVKWSAAQLWNNIPAYYCADEETVASQLAGLAADTKQQTLRSLAAVTEQEEDPFGTVPLNSALRLTPEEQIALISLAETLLYLPDENSINAFIAEKLTPALWQSFFELNNTTIQHTATWEQAVRLKQIPAETEARSVFSQLAEQSDYPLIRRTVTETVTALRERFIFSPDIQQGLRKISHYPGNQRYAINILGESAVTDEAARHYLKQCLEAIKAITAEDFTDRPTPSLSIKLSALHPRLEPLKCSTVIEEVTQRMLHLLILARSENIAVTIEAEESGRQELILLIFENLLRSDLCRGWGGLGVTVQAYSKRALPVLGWLNFLASELQTPIPVRLVNGGYLNSEIRYAQQQRLPDYPVYTRKETTDLSYQLCVRYLLDRHRPLLRPQFACHNDTIINQILNTAEQSTKTFELQRQHYMDEKRFTEPLRHNDKAVQRVYLTIGTQAQLPPHLLRQRLNSEPGFTIAPPKPDYLAACPGADVSANDKPSEIILDSQPQRQRLLEKIASFSNKQWLAAPLINGEPVISCPAETTVSPFNLSLPTGELFRSTADDVREAYTVTRAGFAGWNRMAVSRRAMIIDRFADLLEQHREELIALCIRESGKTLRDAISEVREAVELCRLYAAQATSRLTPQPLAAVAGEERTLRYDGRGIFVCISPWNFPLAIWAGQVVAALLAGNTVIAKPASGSPLIAYRATQLLLDAGVTKDAIALLPGSSDSINEQLIKDFRLSGIAFTGSNNSAGIIARLLAQRELAPVAPLITATSGLNIMITDNSALPELIVRDVIESAYNSAGQRCSALRVLYLQEETAEQLETMLTDAIRTLTIGDPGEPGTDLGPVIDNHALQALHGHIEHCRIHGRLIFEGELSARHDAGYFVAPTMIRLHSIDELSEEHFGPVLHIIRYQKDNLERVIEEINRTVYGLSLSIHSQDNQTIQRICNQLRPGNIDIKGSQSSPHSPRFASMGLSGTGPKAGSPNYLIGFTQETTCSGSPGYLT